MPATPSDARPVLVGFDGSAAARAALRFAVREATAGHAPLRVLALAEHLAEHGAGPDCPCRGAGGRLCLDAAEQALALADRVLRSAGPAGQRFAGSTAMRFGPAAAGLLREARGARLLVLGRQGRQVRRAGDHEPGAVARALLERCPVPLALVPAPPGRGTGPDGADRPSVVALAGGGGDDRAAAVARDWAVTHHARLHVVHVLSAPGRAPAPVTGSAATLTRWPGEDAALDVAASASLVVLPGPGGQTLDLATRLDRPVLLLPR